MQTRVLGRLLVISGAIGETELTGALQEQRKTRERLGELLIRRGIDPEQVARALAEQLRLPYAPPPLNPDPAALRAVDRALATRLLAVPLQVADKVVTVALADPLDLRAIDDLEFRSGRRVKPVVASRQSVQSGLAAYEADAVVRLVDQLPTSMPRAEPDVATLQRASEAPPIVALVEHLFRQAAAARASDLHVEPSEDGLRVRARIDGVLAEIAQLPIGAAPALISRLKVLAGLDISVKRKPQDGRATATIGERTFALRVSTLPTQFGEKVVLRLLDPMHAALPLAQLGLSQGNRARLTDMLACPHGLILVTGPTGSGKTTTLYAALGTLDRNTRNIVTLEDPVEYRLKGITQVQMQRRGGVSFAAALRAVLRQDPDVIMVGELRDRETANVALAAAATGHLVLSTLHTNDAPGTVTRLLHLGTPPYLLASTLIGVVAQRLVRRFCEECKGRKCGRCQSGFRGRVGVFEILLNSPALRALIASRAPEDAIRRQAESEGMRALAGDAERLVNEGLTDASEVRPLLSVTSSS